MSAVLDLCDRWDVLSKGETETTRAVREAYALDAAKPCGQRAVLIQQMSHTGPTTYSRPCVETGIHSVHRDDTGLTWQESVR
jgi:hypothetical protein